MRNNLSLQRKLELTIEFQSAKPFDKKLKLFKKIEKLFDESDLGFQCWVLANDLSAKDGSPEPEVLSFGNRALRILIDNDNNNIPCFGAESSYIYRPLCSYYHNSSFYIAKICTLLASACRKLNRYNEGSSYLNWANRNLTMLLEKDDKVSSCDSKCLSNALLDTMWELFRLKYDTGRFDEAIIPLRKVLEIKESVMEEGCIDLGYTNCLLLTCYGQIMNYEEALPFCFKALEISTKHFGGNSVEVARVMMLLAGIYNDLGVYEKALEQSQRSLDITKNIIPHPQLLAGETQHTDHLLAGETKHADILIGLGKYKEAIYVLKRVISHTGAEEDTRASASVIMASAYCYLGKFSDMNKYMSKAQRILEKIEDEPLIVAGLFRNMSMLYEKTNDFKNAISMLRRALSVPEIPQKLLADGSARLFSLITLYGKEEEGIAFIKDVVEKLKKKFGEEHCKVGLCYKILGARYLESGQGELALKYLVKAKDIMDVTLGPNHLDSLKTSQTLAETYATLRSYDLAIGIQENVVDRLNRLGANEQENLDEAISLLRNMEISVGTEREDLTPKISKCGVSDDGKVNF